MSRRRRYSPTDIAVLLAIASFAMLVVWIFGNNP